MVLCKNDDESISHFLIEYPFTKKVWQETMKLTKHEEKAEGGVLQDLKVSVKQAGYDSRSLISGLWAIRKVVWRGHKALPTCYG